MNNFLMLVLTSLPNDIQGFWDMNILGYTTVGAVATLIGSVAYTLIRARIQRKAVSQGLNNRAIIEDKHYKEYLEYKVKSEQRIAELERDIVELAQANVRKEAKRIVERRRVAPKIDVADGVNIVKNVVEAVEENAKSVVDVAKTLFR